MFRGRGRFGKGFHDPPREDRGTVSGRFSRRGFGKPYASSFSAADSKNDQWHWNKNPDEHKDHSGFEMEDYKSAYTSEELPMKKETFEGFPGDTSPAKSAERKASRMGRIIIRNLPFTATETDLRNLMGKCGKIVDVNIPTKEDGKMRGFAFLQFQSINSAELAVGMFNAYKMKGRPIAVDWAVAKSRYDQAKVEQQNTPIKHEFPASPAPDDESDIPHKQDSVKSSPGADSAQSDGSEDDSDTDSSDSEAASTDTGSDVDSTVEDTDSKKTKKPRTPKRPSDVEEGRTLFVRNLPFDLSADAFRDAFKQFGGVKYALLCHHKDSGYAKGNGFVQFYKKEHADECLSSSKSDTGILLQGRKVDICVAEKPKARRKAERLRHEKPKKDNRNLALLKTGQVDAEESEPMSQNDARKRSMLDKRKQDALKNLHMFVSKTRLSVHNIPKSVDDNQLKSLFLKETGLPRRAVKECRIIRDLQNLDSSGSGKSRGFGFVEFAQHGDAVKAIQAVNNNPKIFKDDKRPIVEFSIENRAALLKREKRLEHSQAKLQMLRRDNPTFPNRINPSQKKTKRLQSASDPEKFVTRKPVLEIKKSVGKPEMKAPEPKTKEMPVTEEPKKPKRKRKVEDAEATDDFSKIVENYKNKLMKAAGKGGRKSARWFDE